MAAANIEKQDVLPSEWIGSEKVFPADEKRKTYIEKNDLDGLPLDLAKFPEFYEARKSRIKKRRIAALGVTMNPVDSGE